MSMREVDLEKLTKEELIYLFRANEWRLHGVDYKSQIDSYRRIIAEKKISIALADSVSAGQALIDWAKKYEGMKLSEIPAEEISKGARLEKELKKANSKYQRLSRAGEKNKYV